VRKLEVCYYLSDDTIEIKEQHIRNSGRDGPTVFLKRGRLARVSNDKDFSFRIIFLSLKKTPKSKKKKRAR